VYFRLIEQARATRDQDHVTRGDIEQILVKGGVKVIGVDEVGRGCLAGPVYAAAVVLDYEKLGALSDGDKKLIRDSKTLSPLQRARIHPVIHSISTFYAIGEASVAEIDAIGILKATFVAMTRAIEQSRSDSSFLLIDGHMPLPDCPVPQLPVIKGDSLCFAIAAASILAKQARDSYMRNIESIHPGYSFGEHVGYGTKKHLEALFKFGPCAIHRRSFAPIRDFVASR